MNDKLRIFYCSSKINLLLTFLILNDEEKKKGDKSPREKKWDVPDLDGSVLIRVEQQRTFLPFLSSSLTSTLDRSTQDSLLASILSLPLSLSLALSSYHIL